MWSNGTVPRPGEGEVTEEERKAALETAFRTMRTELITILYEEDPTGFGSSVSAPEDEYSEEAARLMVCLRGAQTQADIKQELSRMFEQTTDQLVRRVHAAWIEHGGPSW